VSIENRSVRFLQASVFSTLSSRPFTGRGQRRQHRHDDRQDDAGRSPYKSAEAACACRPGMADGVANTLRTMTRSLFANHHWRRADAALSHFPADRRREGEPVVTLAPIDHGTPAP